MKKSGGVQVFEAPSAILLARAEVLPARPERGFPRKCWDFRQAGKSVLGSSKENLRPGKENLWPDKQNLRPGKENLRPGKQNLRPGKNQRG
ncbi:MAG TPA: hypothetical protein VF432_32965 [Thermoanaerobaculia bacterium]